MITAHAFIDWDSARRIVQPTWNSKDESKVSIKDRSSHVENCFSVLQQRVVQCIGKIVSNPPIRITKSRIYHGWHTGKTMTDDRRAWDEALNKLRPVVTSQVSFLPDIEYGDILSCGGPRVPLRDTLRSRGVGDMQQKMVDTALVVDLLSFCRTESRNFQRGRHPEAMAIVIGDDDDLLPGVFVSEKWGLPTVVLRITRADENKHINTLGLTHRI